MMTTSPISSPRPTRFKFTKKHSPAEPPASPTVNMDDDDDSSSLTSIDVIPCAEDASVEDICEQLSSGVRFDEYADVLLKERLSQLFLDSEFIISQRLCNTYDFTTP